MDDLSKFCLVTARKHGMGSLAAMILVCMHERECGYQVALADVSSYKEFSPQWLHTELCYEYLKNGGQQLIPLDKLFGIMLEEVWRLEDGIHATTGG